MGMFSLLFSNPVTKILEQRLWEVARKRYLEQHKDPIKDTAILLQNVREEYKDWVAQMLKEGDEKIKAKWGQFKHEMITQLRLSLTGLLKLSKLESYSIESGQLPYPNAIAAPYELVKRGTAEVMAFSNRKSTLRISVMTSCKHWPSMLPIGAFKRFWTTRVATLNALRLRGTLSRLPKLFDRMPTFSVTTNIIRELTS